MNRRVSLRTGRERGSATTELVLVTPLLLLLMLVAVALGKLAGARLDADEAAHQAARAASLTRTAAAAGAAADQAAALSLAGAGSSCTAPRTTPALSAFSPGGVVRVTVTCRVALGVPGMASGMDITASAASVIDLYRGAET
ncbi:TadE/TadG family type IV pilus assembly protein [Streptomyces violascens]|uniref:TadE/TadG family type IV pilus assembly protein n=1 Tax=Streptomyces violascens TaxID=67381 RepID=UPI0036687DB6